MYTRIYILVFFAKPLRPELYIVTTSVSSPTADFHTYLQNPEPLSTWQKTLTECCNLLEHTTSCFTAHPQSNLESERLSNKVVYPTRKNPKTASTEWTLQISWRPIHKRHLARAEISWSSIQGALWAHSCGPVCWHSTCSRSRHRLLNPNLKPYCLQTDTITLHFTCTKNSQPSELVTGNKKTPQQSLSLHNARTAFSKTLIVHFSNRAERVSVGIRHWSLPPLRRPIRRFRLPLKGWGAQLGAGWSSLVGQC